MADDDIYGSGGYDIDEYGNMVPRGTTLNSNPTATATATPGSGNWTNISQGGPVAVRDNTINTPDSSTGAGCSGSVRRQPPSYATGRRSKHCHTEFAQWGAAAGDSQRANGAGTHALFEPAYTRVGWGAGHRRFVGTRRPTCRWAR